MAITKIQSESLNLADTYDFTGTVTGAGGVNTPFFYGEPSDGSFTRGAYTKVTGMTNNEIDTDSAFDGATFTVPSGQAGKYYFQGSVTGNFSAVGSDGEMVGASIYKNGSSVKDARWQISPQQVGIMHVLTVSVNIILDLSVGDYVELYGYIADFSGQTSSISGNRSSLLGYKIIE